MGLSGKKIIKWVSIVLVLFVVSFQLYQGFYNPISTDTVMHYSTYNGINIEAVAIRDESVLTSNKSGVVSYNVGEGGKIEKDGVVAEIYSSNEEVQLRERIATLQEAIANLEEISGYNNTEAVDIDLLDSKIDTVLLGFVNESDSNEIKSSPSAADLLKLLNRRQIATGVTTDFNSLLNSYKSELQGLEAQKSEPKANIKSETSGYFVSGVDGYEGKLKSKNITKIAPNDLKNLQADNTENNGTVIGKIVSDYEWYLAAVISLDNSLKLTVGSEMTLITDFDSCRELPVTVKNINKGSAGNEAVVVFACTYMNSDLATMRTANMTIVLEEYSGLQVNSKAIRFKDGQRGVYVLSGVVINFVPIDVIYSTESYSICTAETTGVRLRLYDEVIVKGKNLYDGKVVD